jgi:hypothetical protein
MKIPKDKIVDITKDPYFSQIMSGIHNGIALGVLDDFHKLLPDLYKECDDNKIALCLLSIMGCVETIMRGKEYSDWAHNDAHCAMDEIMKRQGKKGIFKSNWFLGCEDLEKP